MKTLTALGLFVITVSLLSTAVSATAAATVPGGTDESSTSTTVEATLETTPETTPQILAPDSGAATPAPVLAASAPLVQIPTGCPSPPVASVVFVGTLLVKDRNTARYKVGQVRAGDADDYIVTDLIDIRYQNETQFLTVGEQYLIGAAPSGTRFALSSKVRETDLLFGGNAVIGLTEKSTECPVIEDPVRTLHLDGTDVANSLFTGLKDSQRNIVLAFVSPIAVAFGILLVLVLIRWLFTAIFVSARRAADGEAIIAGRDGRRHLPDL